MLESFLPVYFHWWHIPFLFTAGLIGESYGALIGGGSFVTQPALLLVGVPLQSTIAIDAAAPLGTEAGIISETWQRVVENKKLVLLMMIPMVLGGAVGTWLLLTVSPALIKNLMITSVVVILLYSYVSKGKVEKKSVSRSNYALLFVFLFMVSLYSNFIGLGEGTFGRIAVMTTLGLSFVQSQGVTAAAKMPARLYSLIITSVAGLIVWPYLLTFWCSDFLAGKYSTKLLKRIPDTYLRAALTIISMGFVVYLLFIY